MAKAKIHVPSTPMTRAGFRDPKHVSSIMLRMGNEHIDALDDLCDANGRSRREIVEILISEASVELQEDPGARINPLK